MNFPLFSKQLFSKQLFRRQFWQRHWRSWLPTIVGIGLVLCLFQTGFSRNLEAIASDFLFHSRGRQPWDERLVIIKIDQRSLDALGWFPWRRDRYAVLLDRLHQAAQNTVVFDVVFSEATPEDDVLRSAMLQHQWVVLGSAWVDGKPWEPTAQLAQAATAMGHLVYQQDTFDSNLVQILPMYQRTPALAIAALQVNALGGGRSLVPPSDRPLVINWPGPISDLPQYSFVDVVQGKVDLQNFAHRIILVGVTAPGFDLITAPFDWLIDAHGVHIHAAAIHNLLHQNALKMLPSALSSWLILGLGLMWDNLLWWLRARRNLWVMLLAPFVWLGMTGVAFWFNYRLPVVLPLLLLGFISFGFVWQERSRLAQSNQQLQQQVTVDSLTQIKNRYFLERAFDQLWPRMMRQRGEIAMILCDIDHFKCYNDTQGHPAGDHCLYQVAQTIQDCLKRPEDFVARYGGEEFLVVLPNTPLQGAVQMAEQIRAALFALALPHPAVAEPGRVTLSLGVVAGFVGDHSAAGLLQKADQALYQAKRLGRDRYVVADRHSD